MKEYEFTEREKYILVILASIITCMHLFGSVAKYFFLYNGSIIEFVEILVFYAILIYTVLLVVKKIKGNKPIEVIKYYCKIYFSFGQILVLFLFIAVIISCLVLQLTEGGSYFETNQECINDMMICVLVMFPCGRHYAKNGFNKGFKIFCHLSLAVLSGIMVWVIYNAINLNIIHTVNGQKIGMLDWANDAIQLTIGTHPNTVGAYSALLFLVSVYLCIKVKGWLKLVYVVEAGIHFVVNALTNSRGAFFAMLCAAAGIAGLFAYYFLKLNNKIKKWILTIVAGVVFVVFLYILRNGVLSCYYKITGLDSGNIREIMEQHNGDEYIMVRNEGEYVASRDLDLTWNHGRFQIWMNAIDIIVSSPKTFMFGVSPGPLSKILGATITKDGDLYAHNQFLEVGLATGIPSLFIFIILLIILAKSCLVYGLSASDENGWKDKIIPLIILYLVISNIMEAVLLYHNYLSGCCFMLLSGWCLAKEKTIKKRVKNGLDK